jgi:Methyltransferase domain
MSSVTDPNDIYVDSTYTDWLDSVSKKYKGVCGIDARKFMLVIPYSEKPVKYGEIGSCCGGSAIAIMRTYCHLPGSEVHCIDPWIDYSDYSEYKNEQSLHFTHFLQNIVELGDPSKLHLHRGFSHTKMHELEDNSFDIFFVDGNHETVNVLEDGILAFRKVKSGGWLVFDDYSPAWPTVMKGVQLFLEGYKNLFSEIKGTVHGHVFCKKK